MIKIIKIRGGLGNQMFGYALYLMLREKYPFSIILFDPLDAWFAHNGFELGSIFSKIKVGKYKFYRRLMKVYAQYSTRKIFSMIRELPEDYGCYNEKYLYNDRPFVVYDGYWQTDKYFYSIKTKVRKYFTFDITKLSEESSNMLIKINTCQSVAVHIRRGDYLNHLDAFGNICNKEYYQRAITFFNKKYDNLFFFFFSDDSEWVKKIFDLENSIVVDFNKDNASWQDMCLMSYCKHNIIANSTFSWWGAWLNENPSKTVIAPHKWFLNNSADNIIPETWILM